MLLIHIAGRDDFDARLCRHSLGVVQSLPEAPLASSGADHRDIDLIVRAEPLSSVEAERKLGCL